MQFIKKNFIYILVVLLIGVGVLLRIPKENKSYKNNDATYHTLLTIKAYDETPLSIHKFLPIVSLGNEEDKNISWGATVKDSKGNYYYTSFSAVGFVCPYLFIKLFSLPINEYSLYVFNSIILILSLFLTIKLMIKLFSKYLSKNFIIILTSLIYLFQMEVMHSQGVIYWIHSIMQVLLLGHFLTFLNYDQNRKNKILFYIFCLILPYVEWTGFISNGAFMILLFIKNYQKNKKINLNCFKESVIVGILTIISLFLFIGHYLLNIEFSVVIKAMYNRFFARNTVLKIASFYDLFKGYILSYKYLIFLISILLITILLLKNYRQKFWVLLKEYQYPIIFFSFIIVENLLLMQHATVYSFDRLKVIFILIILLFLIIITITKQNKNDKFFATYILIFAIFMAILNCNNYLYKKNEYVSNFNYTTRNNLIADYIKSNYNYENSILTSSNSVRGYLNLLFNRGIYESVPFNSDKYNKLKNEAMKKDKKYLINIDCGSNKKSKINNVYISDLNNNIDYILNINESNITLNKIM